MFWGKVTLFNSNIWEEWSEIVTNIKTFMKLMNSMKDEQWQINTYSSRI